VYNYDDMRYIKKYSDINGKLEALGNLFFRQWMAENDTTDIKVNESSKEITISFKEMASIFSFDRYHYYALEL